jgi:hypothetical protein
MSEKIYGQLRDFSLGINQKDGPTLIADQELVDSENAILGKGFVQKRNGYEVYANAPIQSTLTWSGFGSKEWSEV